MNVGPLRGAIGIALVAVSACSSGSEDRAGVTVRDSAGIEIVEIAGPAFATAQWALSAQPEVTIGVVEGDPNEQLYRVSDAVRLADGRIVIANAGTHELRWYGPDGRFLRSVGREGAGPGEFEGMGTLARYGPDSLLVYDWRHRRVSVFDTAGTFARSFPLDLGSGRFAAGVAFFPDGRALVSAGSSFDMESPAGLGRRSQPYWVMTPGGTISDSLGEYEGGEYWVKNDGRRMSVTSRAFGTNSRVVPAGEYVYVGHTGRAELMLRRIADTAVVRIIRWDTPPVRVTPAHIEEYRRERIEGAEERFRDAQRQMLEGMPYPDVFPVFSGVVLDPLNYLWVRQYRKPGDPTLPWWIFDPDGRLLFSFPTPEGVRVVDIGRGYLIGVVTDEFDVERVVLYALDRGTVG